METITELVVGIAVTVLRESEWNWTDIYRSKCRIMPSMLRAFLTIMLSLQAVPQVSKPLERLSVLAGTWKGEGTGTPGNSTGEFSFEWGLNHTVLVRRSFADYPAANGR